MIKKLRTRFVLLSMLALFVLLAVIVTGMNLLNYHAVIMEVDGLLSVLSGNRGEFPELEGEGKRKLSRFMSPETPYETRYFSVLLSAQGEVLKTDTRRIKAVDAAQAEAYAREALKSGKTKGFLDQYRFAHHAEKDGDRVIFLDCGRKLKVFHVFRFASIAIALAGYAVFFFVILFFSGRIIAPATESYEKQKRFITDAGHEIKTPLAIIKADAEVLEMEYADNEWITDIQKQVDRLTALTNDLVYLARMEEAEAHLQMIEFPLSDVVEEAASSFQSLAQVKNKHLQICIEPMITLRGDEKAVTQMVNILMDNALKYSPQGGLIRLKLVRQERKIRLTLSNTTAEALSQADLDALFERFYRVDASRNSKTGGYGVGLSVAKAIVTAHHGRIQGRMCEDGCFEIAVTFSA